MSKLSSHLFFAILVFGLFLGTPASAVHGQSKASDLSAFTEKLTTKYVAGIAKSDKELQKVLVDVFEADWSKAKDCLLFDKWPKGVLPPKDHSAGLKLMDALVTMRTKVCNQVSSETEKAMSAGKLPSELMASLEKSVTEKKLRDEILNELKKSREVQFKPMAPTGAEKRTSDIDVASRGLNTELGVALFNQNFREKLATPWESATVFDYNVYAADWIFKGNFKEEKKDKNGKLIPETDKKTKVATVDLWTPPEHVLVRDGGGNEADDQRLQTERNKVLERAALLHIRRNCSSVEWATYKKHRKFMHYSSQIDSQFEKFENEIKAKEAALLEDATIRSLKANTAWGDANAPYFDLALETRARNEIYKDRLLKLKAVRFRYAQIKETKGTKSAKNKKDMFDLALESTQVLTEALYFANEVYASEGAVLHATQGIQTGKKWQKANVKFVVHLSPDQYLQSFHENMGDALHSLHHYESLDKPYAVFRAGKYIERMLVAGEELPGMKDLLRKHAQYKKLKPLADRAAQVKDSTDGDDPLFIASEKDFNRIVKKTDLEQLKKENIETLRQAILELGAYLPDKASL